MKKSAIAAGTATLTPPTVKIPSNPTTVKPSPLTSWQLWAMVLGVLSIIGVLVWQGISYHGVPNPAVQNMNPSAVAMSAGILVFREGLEAILVLAAVTAGLSRFRKGFWGAILLGVGAAMISTIATWFIAIAVISSVNAPALAIQAGTGLVAIVVLLVVMNWFFHKLYWTGWICNHCARRKKIFEEPNATPARVTLGLALLGFTAIYREGFEIVLFLQDLRLKAGSGVVLSGAGIGLALTAIVAALTFVAHRRLPYKKMLILTGVLLAGVLIVMVGESAQEMQQAGWLTTHPISLPIPEWVGVWFATFPNVEGLIGQLLAASLILGSFLLVRSQVPKAEIAKATKAEPDCEVGASYLG